MSAYLWGYQDLDSSASVPGSDRAITLRSDEHTVCCIPYHKWFLVRGFTASKPGCTSIWSYGYSIFNILYCLR